MHSTHWNCNNYKHVRKYRNNSKQICIFNVYNSPSKTLDTTNVQALLNSNSKVVIFRDHNARHTNWNNIRCNKNGNILHKFIIKSNATIHFANNSYTHYPDNGNQPSTIDFAISKNVVIDEIYAQNQLNSDHIPVTANIKLTNSIKMHTQTSKVTNWEKFRQQLNKNVKINTNLNSKEKINKEIAHFSHAISKYY